MSHVLRGLQAIRINMQEKWIQRARQWLERHQNDSRQISDRTWEEDLPSGTGFLYLRYDYYRNYWPLGALAIYTSDLNPLS